MHIRSLLVGALALAASASASQASEKSRLINRDCAGGSLVTCASAQVRFSRVAPMSGSALSIGHVSSSFDRPEILSRWMADDGRGLECRVGGLDCREVQDPTTVTPEPVTMALVATGLMGMGVGNLRRRLKAKLKGSQG